MNNDSRAVQALDKRTGRVIHEFTSVNAAVRAGFTHSSILKVANNSNREHCGMRWKIQPRSTFEKVLTEDQESMRMEVLIRRHGLRDRNLIAAG